MNSMERAAAVNLPTNTGAKRNKMVVSQIIGARRVPSVILADTGIRFVRNPFKKIFMIIH